MKLLNKILLVVSLCLGGHAYGQAIAPTGYKVTIKGTSNLHDWDENVGKVTASASITHDNGGNISISVFSVTMNVSSIKSTEGSIMDRNTYKALKASQFPEITFVLAAPVNSLAATAGTYVLRAKGKLTIAGVTKEVDMDVKIHAEGGKLVFDGAQQIKMTDYNIDPPTAMFGALKTGNELTISYNMAFNYNPAL